MKVLPHSPDSPSPCHRLLADRPGDDTGIKEYVNTVLKLGSHIINTAPEEKIKDRYSTVCETLVLALEISGVTYFSIFLNEEHCLKTSLCSYVLLHG